jgi:superfamily II DNA or RNA helicase
MRKQSTGDFRVSDMEAKVVDINGDVVRDWRRFNPEGHRTIAVGVSVLHAYELMRLYREAGITAEAVDGKTPAGERKAIFARFRSGATTVLCACAVIDEGLDVPEATCLQITRPTASIRLYRQLIGRVLRPAPGKTEALIIDHTDNWERMPLPDAVIDWSLFQEKVEVQEKPRKADPETGEIKEVEIIEEGEEAPGVNQNGVELVEITAELLANSRPIVARKMLNERLAAELQAVEAGVMAAENLRSWVSRTEVLDDELIHRLGVALGMAPGWSAGQVMLNLLQTRQQETQAIKRLQRVA